MLEVLTTLIRQLAPECCPRCGSESIGGFCGHCRRDFVRVRLPCARCGMPRPCEPCPAGSGWLIDSLRAPFAYAPPLARFIRTLKYDRRRRLGRALGELLAAEIGAADIDALVPVPLHPTRLRRRTFNQSDEIAAAVASRLACPLLIRGVRRRLLTPPQTELDRHERQRLSHRAFAVPANLHGLRIVIVDDVVTTGATINALARGLREAGAARVDAWAVARSVGGSNDTG